MNVHGTRIGREQKRPNALIQSPEWMSPPVATLPAGQDSWYGAPPLPPAVESHVTVPTDASYVGPTFVSASDAHPKPSSSRNRPACPWMATTTWFAGHVRVTGR